ncbi:MAG: LCP family protein, partial [Bacilli bacterium]
MSTTTTQTNNPLSRSKIKRKASLWKKVLLVIAILLIGIASYYIYSIVSFTKEIEKKPEEKQETLPVWTGKDRVNILLLGVDRREESDSTRSDTMLVLSLDPKTKTSQLFSIMRDTWVNIPDKGKHKINAAFALGDAPLAAKTVEEFLDIPIQYYVTTDLSGFASIVDSVGGLEMDIEKDMYYTSKADGPEYDIDLKKGLQKLDGKQALGYVRFRGDASGDYGRSERQRNFIKALAQEVQSANNLVKIPSILKKAAPYIETNMSTKDMMKIASLAYQTDANMMQTIQLPPEEFAKTGYSEDGQWIIQP